MVSISDLDEQIARLKSCEYLKESEVKALCDKAREILIDEANVQRVDAPVTVLFLQLPKKILVVILLNLKYSIKMVKKLNLTLHKLKK